MLFRSLAELRLLRGHFYFDLIRIFERIPYFTENDNPNAATSTEFTRAEIFDKIKGDLQYAWENLPESQDQAGRFNKYVAAAYMAKVSVETKDWGKAIEFADYVIGSHKYELYDNYLDLSKIELDRKSTRLNSSHPSSSRMPSSA